MRREGGIKCRGNDASEFQRNREYQEKCALSRCRSRRTLFKRDTRVLRMFALAVCALVVLGAHECVAYRREGNVTTTDALPFLGQGSGRLMGSAAPRWVRVYSRRATHPAMYVPGDGVIYCPIAKAACAEWRKTLRWMLGIPDWDTGPIHDEHKNGIPLVAQRTVREVELMMNDDTWVKFVVVRDPADRLLSGFLNKCKGKEWDNCPYLKLMPYRFKGERSRTQNTDMKFLAAIDYEPRKVFRDFLLGVQRDVQLNGCRVNSHWRPQYCFCSVARFITSYHVIPFQNMSSEAVALVDHMHRPSPARADLLRTFFETRFSTNYDAKQQGAKMKRETYFSTDALDIIKDVYARDYRLFGEFFEEHEAKPIL